MLRNVSVIYSVLPDVQPLPEIMHHLWSEPVYEAQLWGIYTEKSHALGTEAHGQYGIGLTYAVFTFPDQESKIL